MNHDASTARGRRVTDEPSTDRRARLHLLAFLAFAGHYPAVRVVGRRKLRPEWVRKNVLAIGSTFVAVGVAAAVGTKVGHPGALALAAFTIGHLAWSGWLAWGIATGAALQPVEPR